MTATLAHVRQRSADKRPADRDALYWWIRNQLGLQFGTAPVCQGHSSPFDVLAECFFDRPDLLLIHGARGIGKSFLSAVDTHLDSRFHPGHGTRVLGGSAAQSEQVAMALRRAVHGGPRGAGEDRTIAAFLNRVVRYRNGSEVTMLAASQTSVRGPHVPTLKLDEVDEIDEDVRESAVGIPEADGPLRAKIVMTSTWHRIAGPMAGLMERAAAGEFPVYSLCVFEVLERCPEERSGPHVGGRAVYENCPTCPIQKFCHEDIAGYGRGVPKAKRSDGHFKIDTLIQKTKGVSDRVFLADYLCRAPSAGGLWFRDFDSMEGGRHVRPEAEFHPGVPVHLAIDPGVRTGAVFFQVIDGWSHRRWRPSSYVVVFADYFSEGVPAEAAARAILGVAAARCGRVDHAYVDPSGGDRTPIGPTTLAEYQRGGLGGLRRWSKEAGSVMEGLNLIEALLGNAAGETSLFIHPRCRDTIRALQNFARAKRHGAWQDWPEDEQHPFEDMVEALRGGLRMVFPRGREDMQRLGFFTTHAGAAMA